MEKFIHWLTHNSVTGEAYMLLAHCLAHDWFWIGLKLASHTVITLAYFRFAWKMYKAYAQYDKATPRAKSLLSLTLVFVFCAINVYVETPIDLVFPAKKLFIIASVVLAFISIKLNLDSDRSDFYNQIFKDANRDC